MAAADKDKRIKLDVDEVNDALVDGFNFNLFHLADTWKDANAKPQIDKPNELFSKCMNILYGKNAMKKQYQSGLGKIRREAFTLKEAIVFPVNRLNPIDVFSDPTKKESIYIPSIIKYVIRDGAGISNEVSSNLKVLGIVSDYTDPARRLPTSMIPNARLFPEKGEPIFINDNVFQRLLGKSIIKNFVAIVQPDNACKVTFDIYDSVTRRIKEYTAIISENSYVAENPHAEFMTGNPIKNKWFNDNKDTLTYDIIQEGITRLLCKEIFGDVLMALVALKFKNHLKTHEGEYDGDAGVFTGDGSLTALCINLHLNVVSKSILKGNTSICTAYIFTDTPESILEEEKKVEIDRIISSNRKHIIDIEKVIEIMKLPDTEIEVKDIGNGSLSEEEKTRLIPFLEYFVELIEGINNNIFPHYDDGSLSGEDFVEFKQEASEYKIRNIINYINSSPGKYTISFRAMHNPFPGWATFVPYESVYDRMIFVNKDILTMKFMYIMLDIPYNNSTGGQRGGAVTPEQAAIPYFNLKEHDKEGNRTIISDEEETDPSSYLRKTIEEILKNNPHRIPFASKDGIVKYIEIDWRDVYELLYPIYEVSGTICYDTEFIVYAIQHYLTPKENPVSLISYYYKNIIHTPLSRRTPSTLEPVPSTPVAARHIELEEKEDEDKYYAVNTSVPAIGKRKLNVYANSSTGPFEKLSRFATPPRPSVPHTISTHTMAFGGHRKRKSNRKRKTRRGRKTSRR